MIERKEEGVVVISYNDLEEAYSKQPFLERGDTSQLMLVLLKKEGAPVKGLLALAWDDQYAVRVTHSIEHKNITVEWRKKDVGN